VQTLWMVPCLLWGCLGGGALLPILVLTAGPGMGPAPLIPCGAGGPQQTIPSPVGMCQAGCLHPHRFGSHPTSAHPHPGVLCPIGTRVSIQVTTAVPAWRAQNSSVPGWERAGRLPFLLEMLRF